MRTRSRDFFEAERIRAQRRMEQIKRVVDADPHGALFGRRLMGSDPVMGLLGRGEMSFSDLWRSVFGLEDGAQKVQDKDKDMSAEKKADTTAYAKPVVRKSEEVSGVRSASSKDSSPVVESGYMNARADHEYDPLSGRMVSKNAGDLETASKTSNISVNKSDLEYDPISGRMVPKDAEHLDMSNKPNNISANKSDSRTDHLGYLSPMERSGDASRKTFASMQQTQPEGQCANKAPRSENGTEMSDSKDHSSTLSDTYGVLSVDKNTAMDTSSKAATTSSTPSQDHNASLQTRSSNDTDTNVPSVPSDTRPDSLESTHKHEASLDEPRKFRIHDSPEQSEPILVSEDKELDLLHASGIRGTDLNHEQALNALEGKVDSIQSSVNDIDSQVVQAQRNALASVDEKITELANNINALKLELPEQTSISQDEAQLANAPDYIMDTQARPGGPATYRVLAYDPSTMQVTEAETNSSLSDADEILHPTEVLGRLNHPAKFLHYFANMKRDGYEIVSGDRDVLIFRKFDVEGKQSSAGQETVRNADEISELQPEQPTSTRLTEEASTESNKTDEPRKHGSTIGNAIRRMLFAGTATAGTCYAIGVVTEYFRTGGQDGRGIDGFTVFESERRQLYKE